jgi:antitoxin component of MazEF toxin-antitoxin module
MTITTTQKIIKIGDSAGVTIPAKELKRAGIKPGDEIKISFELVAPAEDNVLNDYAAFKAQYGETLKNLASR